MWLLNSRQEASRTAASVAEIHRHVGGERSSALVSHPVFKKSLDVLFPLAVTS